MCGRYVTVFLEEEWMKRQFQVSDLPDFPPIYNAAPGQYLPVITDEQPEKIQLFRWGFLPAWAKEEKVGYTMINARADGIAEKTSFKKAIRSQRCVVLASGFYEWKSGTERKQKTPYYIHPSDQPLFGMAGIWNTWMNKDTGEVISSYAIITTEANAFMQPLHNRMPVILSPADLSQWLDRKASFEKELELLKPYADAKMEAYEVSTDVNKASHNYPELLEAVGERHSL